MGNNASKAGDGRGGGAPPRARAPGPGGPRMDQARQKPMTLKDGYNQLVHAFIRPPRARYQVSDLGPTTFRVGGSWFKRTDTKLVNNRGLELASSFWEPRNAKEGSVRPCVMYLHGNSSCRAGVLEMLPNLLVAGFSVFAFDFAGCGHSEGEYISLGFYEKDDVATAVAWLRDCGRVSTIGLWGHSMGAATSMMFAHTDPSVAAMVLDCAFSDLQQLVRPSLHLFCRFCSPLPR